MNGRSEILIEGYTEAELLALPREYIQALILAGQPVVFRAGSAAILGEFRVEAAKAFWYTSGCSPEDTLDCISWARSSGSSTRSIAPTRT
jgi:hypothetical protein